MAPATIRLATASPGTRPTTAETLAHLEQFAQRAAAKGVDILLLPEAYIGGYPRGTHFGSVIGSRSREGREEYLRYFQSAVDLGDTVGDGAGAGHAWVNRELPSDAVPGSADAKGVPNRRGDGTREELERIARETGVFIVTGLIEKAGGSLYCAVVYVCPKLGVIGKRRKVMPTGTERLVWAQGSPATLRAVSTVIRGVRVNLAAAICWENYMPLLRQALYAQNINLYLAPTADGRDAWLSLLRTIAIEGRCFVVSSNMCVRNSGTTASTPGSHIPIVDAGHANRTTDAGATADENAYPFPSSTARSRSTTHRRCSCLTEEGFEIALPSPSSSPNRPQPRRRRRSIFDEDGNEIVLPAQPPTTTTTAAAGTTSSSAPPPPSRGRDRPRSRRRSVFDEDGNEIVLCQLRNGVEEEQEEGQKEGGGGIFANGALPQEAQPHAPAQHQCTPATAGSAPDSSSTTLLPQPPPPTTTTITTTTPTTVVPTMKPTTTPSTAAQSAQFASRGGSAIVSPFGDVLAGPQWDDDDGLVCADVDLDDCVRGRLDLDAAGSYSRNDSFRLAVAGLEMVPLPYY